jgi:hypothetical protein
MTEAAWLYSHRFLEALTSAASLHAGQQRKGSAVPYPRRRLDTAA